MASAPIQWYGVHSVCSLLSASRLNGMTHTMLCVYNVIHSQIDIPTIMELASNQ